MRKIVSSKSVHDMEQMMAALQEFLDDARREGHHISTVYPNKMLVTLVEETLTDGSKTMNIDFHDGDRMPHC